MGVPPGNGVNASGQPPVNDQASAVLSGVFTAVGPSAPFAFRGPMNMLLYASLVDALATTALSLAATVNSAAELAIGTAINSKNVPPGTTIGAIAGTDVTLAPPPVTYPGILNPVTGQVTLPPGSNVAALLGATVTIPSTASPATLPANTTVLAINQVDIAATSNGPAGSPGTPGIITLSNAPLSAPANNQPIPLQFALGADAITVSGADAAAVFTGAGVVYTGNVQLERSFDGGKTFVLCNIGTGTLAQFNEGTPVSVTFGEPEKNVLYRLNCTALSGGNINYRISQTGGANEALAIGPLYNG